MRNPSADRLAFHLTLLWGLVLLLGLLFLQWPFLQGELRALGRLAGAVAVAGAVALAALALGRLLLRPLALPATANEQWLAAALLGLGALGWLWLGLGLVRLPPAWLTLLLVALPLPLLVPPLRAARPRLPTTLPRPIALFLGGTLLLSALTALLPPHSFDALLYHLRLPELWLALGNVLQPQRSAQFYFPVLIEGLATPALQLGGPRAAGLLVWGYFPLLLALTWTLTRRTLPSAPAPLVLLLVATMPMVPLLAGWLYTDLALACYQVGTFWALLRWRAAPGSRWHWLAGAFIGMAMGVKYTSLLTPLLAAGLILFWQRGRAIAPLLQVVLLAALAAAPSYVRALLGTGNPLFPFALPSPYWDDFRAAWYAAAGTGIGLDIVALLALPLTTTLGLGDLSFFDGRSGPLIATFAPLALWLLARGAGQQGERRRAWLLVVLAGAFVALWVVGVISSGPLRQGRFLITPLLLLCPVVAWAIARLGELPASGVPPRRLALFLVAVWAAIALATQALEFAQRDPLRGLLAGPVGERDWLSGQAGGYALLVEALHELPADSKALLIMEPRSYGSPLLTEADTLLYEWPWRLERADGDLAPITGTLCAEGFTHAAIWWRGDWFEREEAAQNYTPISRAQLQRLRTWRDQQRLVWELPMQGEDGPRLDYQLLALRCPSTP